MASSAALLLALTPLTHEASPLALGLGNEQLLQTEGACGAFCLNASNAHHDVRASAHASTALVPQQMATSRDELKLSPTKITTYDVSWHPYFDVVAAAGYRSSTRSTERSIGSKTVRRMTASTTEIPAAFSTRLAESFSLAAQYVFRTIELKQENLANSASKLDSMSAQPNRWGANVVWQKDDLTGIGISYLAPTSLLMKLKNGARPYNTLSVAVPRWTDPQEFTASFARFSAIQPPEGVVFGPFENVFHGAMSIVTWESGEPVAYSALASSAVSKDGWNLTDSGAQTEEFRFNTLDPSVSLSAGLQSLWARNSIGSISTYTHIRMNHIASKKEQNQWQGGFGIGITSRFITLQASSLWREKESGYALGLSSSL